jgi:hypothetical protein
LISSSLEFSPVLSKRKKWKSVSGLEGESIASVQTSQGLLEKHEMERTGEKWRESSEHSLNTKKKTT